MIMSMLVNHPKVEVLYKASLSPGIFMNTVSMECAMGLRCCRPVSHPSIPSRSLKPDSLILLFLFL